MEFVCPLQEVHVAHPATADIDDLVAQAAKPRDVLVIEIVGLVAATLAGAIALRGMRGTSTPYAVPVALIVLFQAAGRRIDGGPRPALHSRRIRPGPHRARQLGPDHRVGDHSSATPSRSSPGLIDTQGQGILHDVSGQGPAGDRPAKSH